MAVNNREITSISKRRILESLAEFKTLLVLLNDVGDRESGYINGLKRVYGKQVLGTLFLKRLLLVNSLKTR